VITASDDEALDEAWLLLSLYCGLLLALFPKYRKTAGLESFVGLGDLVAWNAGALTANGRAADVAREGHRTEWTLCIAGECI